MWEESPIGDWTLEVINDGRSIVELKKWSLAFFGTKDHPQPNIREVPRQQPNEPSEKDLDLNQVPDVPIQKTADVTNMHSKPLKQSESVEEVFLEHCLDARDPKWCSICESGFLMLNGRCLESCPAEGYYQGTENHQDSCLQCYYSCKTCNGPNDYQVSFQFFKYFSFVFLSNSNFLLFKEIYMFCSLIVNLFLSQLQPHQFRILEHNSYNDQFLLYDRQKNHIRRSFGIFLRKIFHPERLSVQFLNRFGPWECPLHGIHIL